MNLFIAFCLVLLVGGFLAALIGGIGFFISWHKAFAILGCCGGLAISLVVLICFICGIIVELIEGDDEKLKTKKSCLQQPSRSQRSKN